MTLPDITIILLTYASSPDRATYAHRTIQEFAEYASYPGTIHVHIADDGSPEGHVAGIVATIGDCMGSTSGTDLTLGRITSSNSGHRGYGANYNEAFGLIQPTPVYLPLEDDWELRRPWDMAPVVADLMAWAESPDPAIGCIRLGYLGWTGRFDGTVVRAPRPGGAAYLHLDPASPERHVFSGHPRLETSGWNARVGRWPEGLNPGETEFEVCANPAARQGVAWPMDLTPTYGSLFGHFGAASSRTDEGR